MKPDRNKRRTPRRATPKSLENAALYHLARFASSAENLRRVLMRRVERSARVHETDVEEGAAAVAEIVARFTASGLIDDAGYAAGRALSLFRRGASRRKIRVFLSQKGVGDEDIEAALAGLASESGDPELAAALTLARRRRLGPYGVPGGRDERRRKDLAILARAGFGYQIAQRVIAAKNPAELEEEAKPDRSSG
jgi:regulatory protein